MLWVYVGESTSSVDDFIRVIFEGSFSMLYHAVDCSFMVVA
jgi:hypothetical protein